MQRAGRWRTVNRVGPFASNAVRTAILSIAALTISCWASEAAATTLPQSATGPVLVAHRGGRETYPENTLPALVSAARAGEIVETDVWWTSDGVPVLMHDGTTARTMYCAGGPYVIADTSWPVLRDSCRSRRALSRDGRRYWIPRFAVALTALAALPAAEVWPEVKVEQTPSQNLEFARMVTNAGMASRTVVTSFTAFHFVGVQSAAASYGARLRTLLYDCGQPEPVETVLSDGVETVSPSLFTGTADYVARMHAAGLKVAVWTADNPDQWQRVTSVGADYVITDLPDAYRAWVALQTKAG